MTASILPGNYIPTSESDPEAPKAPSRYFKPSSIKPGQSQILRLCGTAGSGHAIAGYQYFTTEGQPRRFATFPRNYLDDIGLTWEGKNHGTGEKATPAYFLSWVCLIKGDETFSVIDIQQKKVREAIEAILAMEDYDIEQGEMANFYLQITRQGEKKDTTYTVIPTLKSATSKERELWHQARESIWLPALFEGGDPFEGKPSTGAKEHPRAPMSSRDELGADNELGGEGGWD